MNGKTIPRVLTIAGSDSGGGAGIEADLKTMTILGCFGMAAITSVTAQNTTGVFGIHDIPPEMVAKQIDVVIDDIGVDAVKIGMLSNSGIIHAVADILAQHQVPNLVIDPVMVAKSGDALLQEHAQAALVSNLLPLAHLVTPNIPEAEVLADMKITNESSLKAAGEKIYRLGLQAVLIKGGHLESDEATDWLFDGDNWCTFSAPRIATQNTHGTGCTYSAAIASLLACGIPLRDAVSKAKDYLTNAIKTSYDLGSGHGPLNHMWPYQ